MYDIHALAGIVFNQFVISVFGQIVVIRDFVTLQYSYCSIMYNNNISQLDRKRVFVYERVRHFSFDSTRNIRTARNTHYHHIIMYIYNIFRLDNVEFSLSAPRILNVAGLQTQQIVFQSGPLNILYEYECTVQKSKHSLSIT